MELFTYKKSNILIGAKYASTLKEEQILAVALSNKDLMDVDAGGTIRVSIPATLLRKELGGNTGSFYRDLKNVAKKMNKRQIGIVDAKTDRFAYFQLMQSCIYSEGSLNITFNSDLTDYILDRRNSTEFLLETSLSFQSVYTFKLYEILYKDMPEGTSSWKATHELCELQLALGIVDASDERVEDVLNFSKQPDYEKAVLVSKTKKESLLEWSNFKRHVLDNAIREIEDKSNLKITTDITKENNKVKQIHFYIEERGI